MREYKTGYVNEFTAVATALNKEAEAGWQLHTIMCDGPYAYYLLEREKTEDKWTGRSGDYDA